MTPTTTIDLGHVARDLGLPADKVARTLELLDEGNTVPFITRYRKDQTGGLDEEQIREIQERVSKIRQLHERRATILKTIEAQGKLTPELAAQIEHANTPKRLEDLYLPFKPKKRSLATIARERGLEPLAIEIFEAHPEAADLQARAQSFVDAAKELNSAEDVLSGVGHLMAEHFSENAELRGRLRRIFQRSGKIVCSKVETPPAEAAAVAAAAEGESGREGEGASESIVGAGSDPMAAVAEQNRGATAAAAAGGELNLGPTSAVLSTQYSVHSTASSLSISSRPNPASSGLDSTAATPQPTSAAVEATATTEAPTPNPEPPPPPLAPSPAPAPAAASDDATDSTAAGTLPAGRLFEPPSVPVAGPLAAVALKKKKKKKKKKVIGEHAFKDYYDYVEPLSRVPPHRVLAINRGERAHAIRVKIEADIDALLREAEQFLIGPDHPHGEFLRACVRDSLFRLIVPSLEREVRRELTERAEQHAVEVFIRNLRKLLLQPPTRGRRLLAIDPGFKSGSKMAALDEFGNVLGHGMIFVIGKDEDRRQKARTRLADMVKQHQVSVIAIGNGTGCRETEQLVADCLAGELNDRDVAYVIVNEAGASIYSTSPLGREELPQFDALQRGAISIGRRLLDPLSEMVKIHPANLGVGLYQHDIKAKHLKDSLDAVVESCVNFVGVDVNSASPALLRYVSGMNALTARRVYEHRREKGPFKNREELKDVTGFGDQTFVQAAGFLKVIGGENPLDATWIHPESYEIARRVLDNLGCDVAELAKSVPAIPKEEKREFAAELQEQETGDRGQGTGVRSQESGDRGQEAVGSAAAETTDGAAAGTDAVPSTQCSVLSTPPDAEAAATTEPPEAVAAPDSATNHELTSSEPLSVPESAAVAEVAAALETETSPPPPPLAPSPPPESPATTEAPPSPRSVIAERAASVDVHQLAGDLGVGTHLLHDILTSLTRPGIDPRDNLAPPVFRRGIIKLEDLAAGMELSGTVLNVVDFGVFVDIGLSDSGLVHISRLADRYIRDPHEVVGVGDVLKVWVVDVDKSRRRVSLTAIAPGSERPPRPPRGRRERQPQGQQHGQQQQGQQQPRPPSPEGRRDRRPPRPPRQPLPQGAPPPAGVGAPPEQRPPRPQGGRRDQRRGGRPDHQQPRTIDRPPTKPKKIKPLTKAMEEGREPMRSFSDLLQLMDKKKQPPPPPIEPPPATGE